MTTIFYDLPYTREQAKEILGKVRGFDAPIKDQTYIEYRQIARRCCGSGICVPREGEIFSRELAILCLIAHTKRTKTTQRLIKDSQFEGFPERKAKQIAEKFGVQYGEIRRIN